MSNYQVVGFGGNLTRDVAVFTGKTGNQVAKFSIAVNSGYGEKKQTAFIDCVAFPKQFGEKMWPLVTALQKGTNVGVKGEFVSNSFDGKDGKKVTRLELIINKLDFLSPKKKDGEASPAAEGAGEVANTPTQGSAVPPTSEEEQDDIPF